MKVQVQKAADGVLTFHEKPGLVFTGVNAWIDPASAREFALNLLAKSMKAEAEREAFAATVLADALTVAECDGASE